MLFLLVKLVLLVVYLQKDTLATLADVLGRDWGGGRKSATTAPNGVIIRDLLGEHNKGRNRMNSYNKFLKRYIGVTLGSIRAL